MALPTAIESAKTAFAKRHRLDPSEPRTLEAFFTHQVLAHRNLTDFAAEQSWQGEKRILTGGAGDIQLDAVAIIINGELIRTEQDLDELERCVSEDEPVEISFIFVQATGQPASSDRLGAKISGFSDGVFAFLDHDGPEAVGINSSVMSWIALKNRIFAIIDENELESCCECAMYLVWGRPTQPEDGNVKRAITTAENKIRRNSRIAGKFHTVRFAMIDSVKLEELIVGVDHNIVVSLDTFVQVPIVPGAKACYLGYFRADHLLRMITTDPEEGEPQIRSSFFAANVRSYLGSGTRVNAAIADTLRNEKERAQFALRSNGIAVTARDYEALPNRQVRLKFAQIVNGCQTSHTLFNFRDLLLGPAGEQVYVPVKIIVTDDPKVLSAAILALNRQTPIDDAQVVTERDFVERLRSAFADPARLAANRAHFESRVNEYNGQKDIDKSRIISLYELARAYASVFLPHPEQLNVHGKVPVIDQISKGVIFNKAQTVEPYYLAGVMILRAREALARIPNQRKWDRYGAKNQLLFAMRLVAGRLDRLGEPPADTASAEFAAYVTKLEAIMLDPVKARSVADTAVRCVREAVGGSTNLNFRQAGKAEMTANVRRRIDAAPLT
jgi:hypothetical protein